MSNRKPLVVGLVGRSGSGKSWTARELDRRLAAAYGSADDVDETRNEGDVCGQFSFAFHLRSIASWVFRHQMGPGKPLSSDQFWDEAKKDLPFPLADGPDVTTRVVLQRIGSVLREIYPAIFLDPLTVHVKRLVDADDVWEPSPRVVFVTDVRYENEAALIRQQGGFLVRMVPDDTMPQRAQGAAAGHSSETEQDRILCEMRVRHTIGKDPERLGRLEHDLARLQDEIAKILFERWRQDVRMEAPAPAPVALPVDQPDLVTVDQDEKTVTFTYDMTPAEELTRASYADTWAPPSSEED